MIVHFTKKHRNERRSFRYEYCRRQSTSITTADKHVVYHNSAR